MIETELDVLRDVSRRLESAGISFMLTGSVAMNYYAQPRMTRDIDLVVSLNETQAEAFFRLFETEYYLDRHSVADAISRRRIFNLIHNDAVIKVDCVVLKTDAYRQEEFARRRQINLGDFETWIVSREDLVLSKLVWAKDSKSEMQLRDVRNLLSEDCDMDYLRSRAKTLQSAGYASGFMATSLMSRLTSNTSFNQKLTEPLRPVTNLFAHSSFY
jgi:predicted nucleotidyltransferase